MYQAVFACSGSQQEVDKEDYDNVDTSERKHHLDQEIPPLQNTSILVGEMTVMRNNLF